MALTWTKTETGYTAGDYKLTKTPGKRWFVEHKSTLLEDGKQFRKLAEAQALAESHLASQQTSEGEERADPTTTSDTKGAAKSAGPITETAVTVTTCCSDFPKTVPAIEGTATLPDVVTASSSFSGSQDAVRVAIAADVKFLKAHPRESLNDQFTRLEVYRDIGIVRRFRRDVA